MVLKRLLKKGDQKKGQKKILKQPPSHLLKQVKQKEEQKRKVKKLKPPITANFHKLSFDLPIQ